jgi:8-oxo-dGTP diphosphatase
MNYTKGPLFPSEEEPRNLEKVKKPAISVQVLIFSVKKNDLEIILINRIREPFKGYWSIPGDIIAIDESLDDAARRILYEKTGIHDVYLEQLYTFGSLKRDPRDRVIAVTYFALLPHESVDLSKAPNALHAQWTSIHNSLKLAFDHKEIIDLAVKKLKTQILDTDMARALLSEKFRLSTLQKTYEVILGEHLDKRNFRKKILSLDLIESTGDMYKTGNHRPAQLFRFKKK